MTTDARCWWAFLYFVFLTVGYIGLRYGIPYRADDPPVCVGAIAYESWEHAFSRLLLEGIVLEGPLDVTIGLTSVNVRRSVADRAAALLKEDARAGGYYFHPLSTPYPSLPPPGKNAQQKATAFRYTVIPNTVIPHSGASPIQARP
jgi:hypothetical protein